MAEQHTQEEQQLAVLNQALLDLSQLGRSEKSLSKKLKESLNDSVTKLRESLVSWGIFVSTGIDTFTQSTALTQQLQDRQIDLDINRDQLIRNNATTAERNKQQLIDQSRIQISDLDALAATVLLGINVSTDKILSYLQENNARGNNEGALTAYSKLSKPAANRDKLAVKTSSSDELTEEEKKQKKFRDKVKNYRTSSFTGFLTKEFFTRRWDKEDKRKEEAKRKLKLTEEELKAEKKKKRDEFRKKARQYKPQSNIGVLIHSAFVAHWDKQEEREKKKEEEEKHKKLIADENKQHEQQDEAERMGKHAKTAKAKDSESVTSNDDVEINIKTKGKGKQGWWSRFWRRLTGRGKTGKGARGFRGLRGAGRFGRIAAAIGAVASVGSMVVPQRVPERQPESDEQQSQPAPTAAKQEKLGFWGSLWGGVKKVGGFLYDISPLGMLQKLIGKIGWAKMFRSIGGWLAKSSVFRFLSPIFKLFSGSWLKTIIIKVGQWFAKRAFMAPLMVALNGIPVVGQIADLLLLAWSVLDAFGILDPFYNWILGLFGFNKDDKKKEGQQSEHKSAFAETGIDTTAVPEYSPASMDSTTVTAKQSKPAISYPLQNVKVAKIDYSALHKPVTPEYGEAIPRDAIPQQHNIIRSTDKQPAPQQLNQVITNNTPVIIFAPQTQIASSTIAATHKTDKK